PFSAAFVGLPNWSEYYTRLSVSRFEKDENVERVGFGFVLLLGSTVGPLSESPGGWYPLR
ncbi:hypothetical protein, partial [Acinetobacter baumannii]|uniref:hypothetical protein n=1 Tax=Acinetobacter baumannii TaxID=470 RepID=UPI00148AD9F1